MKTPNPQEWYEKELDALIRDATKVGSIPKSELRQRFTAIIAETRRMMKEEMEDATKRSRQAGYEEGVRACIQKLKPIGLGENSIRARLQDLLKK